ncbi:MAG: ATP-binding protein, partial [Candidatus Zixiibacteriota bacterium]
MDRAQILFDEIKKEGEARIDRFIEDRHVEELILDYKRSADDGATPTTLHNNDKRNLARAISGFGNSEGGIIVWGVECSKDSNGVDVPTAKHALKDAKRFQAHVERLVSGCTLPVHSQVQNHVIVTADGSGFVATFVPRSNLA